MNVVVLMVHLIELRLSAMEAKSFCEHMRAWHRARLKVDIAKGASGS